MTPASSNLSRTPTPGTLILGEDIKPEWLKVIRRVQSVARTQQGVAIIAISILVDEDGKPICWTDPVRTLLEPQSQTQKIIELMGRH